MNNDSPWWTRTGLLLVLGAALVRTSLACVGGPTPELMTADASDTSDASNTSVEVPPDDGPPPSVELLEPWPCPEVTACPSNPLAEGPFSLIGETPSNVTLQVDSSGRLLGYDATAEQFVYYDVLPGPEGSDLPKVTESYRFDKKYERVHFTSYANALACAGTACDLFRISYAVEAEPFDRKVARVPDDGARWANSDCVASDGILCLSIPERGLWSRTVPSGTFDPPIAFFARLDGGFLVVDTAGKTWLVRGEELQPLDAHSSDPLTAVIAEEQRWIGRTTGGRLVMGSLKGSHTCESPALTGIDEIGWSPHGFFIRRGGTVVDYQQDGEYCATHHLPETTTRVVFARCAWTPAPLAFDEHRIFGKPLSCVD